MNRREWRWVVLVTLVLVIASSLPYLVAWMVRPAGTHFTGLLFNPQDGNSYVAKMRQGLAGSWSFRLPYTPEPHDGAHVYLFYLSLGHLARWTGLPLIAVYHAARVLGGAAMLLALYRLASRLSGQVREPRAMFLFAALGSGLGWLMGLLGVVTVDLWVPEAFPAYALLVNAHFPLVMGLMMGIASCGLRIADREWQMANGHRHRQLCHLGMAMAAIALGVIQPFGLVPVYGGLGVMLVARTVRQRVVPRRVVAWIAGTGAVALPYPLYMQWAIRHDPVLAAWNAQNVTHSPPLWDWMLGYGLVLALALLGAARAARRGSAGDWLLLGWVIVTVAGMYVPLPLQRRLSLGLGIPIGLLAGMGWRRVERSPGRARRRRLLQGLAVAFCALTPIFLVLMALLAALAGGPWFYLSDGERAALEWLRDEGEPNAVVLCAPQMGLFVPAWGGQRVVYGHPFETVDAERRKAQVEAYWAGEMSLTERESFLRENRVRYVLVGPRELESGEWRTENGEWRMENGEWRMENGEWRMETAQQAGELVCEAGDVRVYEVDGR